MIIYYTTKGVTKALQNEGYEGGLLSMETNQGEGLYTGIPIKEKAVKKIKPRLFFI